MNIAEIDLLARFLGSFTKLVRIARVEDMVLCLELAGCKNPALQAALESTAKATEQAEMGALDELGERSSKRGNYSALGEGGGTSEAGDRSSPLGLGSAQARESARESRQSHFPLYLAMTRGRSYAYTDFFTDFHRDSHTPCPPSSSLPPLDSKRNPPQGRRQEGAPKSTKPLGARLGLKHYGAPFDIALARLARSEILSSTVYGGDRIVRLELLQSRSYKQLHSFVQFEFSGKYTNVILLDSSEHIIEALRHISPAQSCRPVRVGQILPPMPKNPREAPPLESPAPLESLPALLQAAYLREQARSLASLKQSLLAQRSKTLSRLQALLESLPKAESLLQESREQSHQASLLLSYLHTVKPYETRVELLHDGARYDISLPPSPTPQAAVNALFHSAKKLARKARNIHKEAQNLQEKIAFTQKERDFIAQATRLDLLQVLQPPKQHKKQKPKNPQAFVVFLQGVKISIGRNERENIQLLESARADDLWLHIRDLPSSHLIIHCGKQAVAESLIYKAGEILLGVSGFKQGDFLVDYTKRKFVKMISGAQVVYSKQQVLHYRV